MLFVFFYKSNRFMVLKKRQYSNFMIYFHLFNGLKVTLVPYKIVMTIFASK
jgi:hypothetical protein